jgi:hypothetical protein
MRRIGIVAVLGCVFAVLAAAPAGAKTVWLCKPGLKHSACAMGLGTTRFSQTAARIDVIHPQAAKRRRVDCFYVYPTVSDQKTGNANRHIDPEERSIVRYQAARYQQYCKLYAPMYRQLTLAGIGQGSPTTKGSSALAYGDVKRAFADYLKHDNHGRGFVLIGHSQGSFMLKQLVHDVLDKRAAVRRRLVSAILLGGNVTVRKGGDVGGSFTKVPACRSRTQTGCVIAFSTFDATPPADALFGRSASAKQQVLCTNPAALGGGKGTITPISPSEPFAPGTLIGLATGAVGYPPKVTASTPWVEAPLSFSAACSSRGGAHVLRVTPVGGSPTPKAEPTAAWGLHLLDANIALGDLVDVVHAEARAYAR